jgi:hypothetical protein
MTTIGAACACVGCGYAVTASDGTIFKQTEAVPDALSSALLASASRDLPCANSNLEVKRLEPEREYAVTGCGSRVIYRVDTPTVATKHIELVSRAFVGSAAGQPAF